MFGLDIGMTTLGLAVLAGLVTTLSPCVLPLLPMIAAAATGRHPLGLVALAAGLALAFTVVGVTVSASGHLLGLSEDVLRLSAGTLMVGFSVVLLSSRLQAAFGRLAAGMGNRAHGAAGRISSDHPAAQFGIGALMGVAWSPCVGPTLGAAIGLAATGSGIAEATVIMAAFSVAAVVPLTAAGLLSRKAFMNNRDRMKRIGDIGRIVMGISLLVVGLLVLTGFDKTMEAWLLDHAPAWLPAFTTSF